jgi:3-deoxy-manno-octulosonate cytidylyltransferase (CMP-KDO synthetase)
MKFIGVIPARFNSTRFPGKPLAIINGKTMIQHVYEQASKSRYLNTVIVATDHEAIRSNVESFGGNVIMTRGDHQSGSDRVSEVASRIEGDYFINIQGDEPLISPILIDDIITSAKDHPDSVVTAKSRIINDEEILDPNIVKVISNEAGEALLFSRSVIPFNRSKINVTYYKHIGIYCFPKKVLNAFVKLPISTLERIEMLEQLRLLENGYRIQVIETEYNAMGVDVPGDIVKIENLLNKKLKIEI